MPEGGPQKLRKDLSLFGVFCLATGTTLSAGFFLLPGLAFKDAGPAVIVSYLIAALVMIAPMFCVVELATAMPKAGGTYFFLDRSLGPLAGTIGGLGTWLALTLKAAFALVGMGAYISLIAPNLPNEIIATVLALTFGGLNLLGAKASTRFQIVMVVGLLALLSWFIVQGTFSIKASQFKGFFDEGGDSIFATAGMVFISYVGVTKVASVAEEIKDPARNLPLGVFLAFGTSFVVYMIGLTIMVGVVPADIMANSLTPVGDAANVFAGKIGLIAISSAALFAFMSVANAGILSSSRYPLAMSRDHLLPSFFRRLNSKGAPAVSLVVTVAAVILYIWSFNVLDIAKLASAFQLVMFALLCLAVIVMRESNIESYDPTFKAPWYPWVPLAGFFGPCWMIIQMGPKPSLFAAGLIMIGVIWFFAYANKRISRGGAIFHVFERLGQRRFDGLDQELRGILKERGLKSTDLFDEIIATAQVIDAEEGAEFEQVTRQAADRLARATELPAGLMAQGFLDGTRVGATPVSRGVALPHIRLAGIDRPFLVIVRSRFGLSVCSGEAISETDARTVNAVFYLASPSEDPAVHLRLLAQLASCVEQEGFMNEWLSARTHETIREVLLRDDRYLTIMLRPDTPAEVLIDCPIREVAFPSDSLIAIVRRGSHTLIPQAGMVLRAGDRLTVLGESKGIAELSAWVAGESEWRARSDSAENNDTAAE